MKEPKKIPLTDNPRNKEPEKLPLTTPNPYDIDMVDDIWVKNENNKQNNTTSIQQLESDTID
jgi:hypothetical protein